MIFDSSFQSAYQSYAEESGSKRLKSQSKLKRTESIPNSIFASRTQNSIFSNFQNMKADRYVYHFNQQQMFEEFDPENMKIEIRKSLNVPAGLQNSKSLNTSVSKELSKSKLQGAQNTSIDLKLQATIQNNNEIGNQTCRPQFGLVNTSNNFILRESAFIEKLRSSTNSPTGKKAKSNIEVRTRANPVEKLLKTIDEKKQEIKKEIKKRKQKEVENRLLEKKFKDMENKYNIDSICKDSTLIEKIKRRDQQLGGERLLDKLGQINSRVDYLKKKGFRLILQHEENKRNQKQAKIRELTKINESTDYVRQSSIPLNADILDQ